MRGPHHLVEQRDAVHVAPLHVVDVEDERSASRERAHELAQSAESLVPYALSVVDRQIGEIREARDALEDGKQPGERGGVPRRRERSLDLLDANEQPRERVHEAVHGLVGDRLALVRAAAEHLPFAARLEVVEEALDEGGLAHAGAAAHAQGHGLARRPRTSNASRSARSCSSRPTSTCGCASPPRHRASSAGRSASDRPEASQNLRAIGPLRGLLPQEADAELFQVGRDAPSPRAGRRGIFAQLASEDVDARTHEGAAPGQGLVEHDPDRVPVARRGRHLAGRLLGRDVGRRAHDPSAGLRRVVAPRARARWRSRSRG